MKQGMQVGNGVADGSGMRSRIALSKAGTIIDQRTRKGLHLVREICERLSAVFSTAFEDNSWRSTAKALKEQLVASQIDLGAEIHAGHLTSIANAICKI